MTEIMSRKLRENRGVSLLVAILLILVIVMAVLSIFPTFAPYEKKGEEAACAAGLDTARRRLAEDYLSGNTDQNELEAMRVVTYAMNGWDDLCPNGGKVYLVRTNNKDGLPYDLVCGMHDSDKKRCTRLNSEYVLKQLEEGLRRSKLNGEDYPEQLEFKLNGSTWTALLTDEEVPFKRGTSTTKGYEDKGVVAYYGIAGHSEFGEDFGSEEGDICYFSFADEEHCAMWQENNGWTGDSHSYNAQ